jgi:hypothetical protein
MFGVAPIGFIRDTDLPARSGNVVAVVQDAVLALRKSWPAMAYDQRLSA